MNELENNQNNLVENPPAPEITSINSTELEQEKLNLELDENPGLKDFIDAIVNLTPEATEAAIRYLNKEIEKMRNSNNQGEDNGK